MRRLGASSAKRISGSALFDALCSRSSIRSYTHYLVGSSPETLRQMQAQLSARYPGIQIAGLLSPPFAPVEAMDVEAASDRINAASPDIVWVGMGAPKQELWITKARPLLTAPVVCGIGAVFDFVAGTKRRAPTLLQRLGLEWAFRLLLEPRRLASRYLRTNATFVFGMPGLLIRHRARSDVSTHRLKAWLSSRGKGVE
jgi:N-acetylglucosaminyldiphosphoundecaprenol N-acetyl-beta-D-mannosaminyltransferase